MKFSNFRYAGLDKNDTADSNDGVCVSFWVQGCPIHCKGCHNPQTWDEKAGMPLPENILDQIDEALEANGVERNFSILGGEPLASYNIALTTAIVKHVHSKYPTRKIYCWTGYTLEQLKLRKDVKEALENIDILIVGPFIQELRDVTLELRGSTNQKILEKNKNF